jgi:hypothetical protein
MTNCVGFGFGSSYWQYYNVLKRHRSWDYVGQLEKDCRQLCMQYPGILILPLDHG